VRTLRRTRRNQHEEKKENMEQSKGGSCKLEVSRSGGEREGLGSANGAKVEI